VRLISPPPGTGTDASGDVERVERARRGDQTAQKELYLRHAPAVASLLRRTFGPQADVEEGVQQTFLVAFEELGALREPAAVRGWLLRIALRTCRRLWWTLRLREWFVPADEVAAWDESELVEAVDPDDRALLVLLGRRLRALPLAVRQAVVVRHAFGFTLEETADICHCSLATAKRRIAEGERILRGENR